jgi:hypothetical protein
MAFLIFESRPFDPTVSNAGDQLAARAALPTDGHTARHHSLCTHDDAFRDFDW